MRLVDVERAKYWSGRGHFFAAAAEAMRRILVETARRKGSPPGVGTGDGASFWTMNWWLYRSAMSCSTSTMPLLKLIAIDQHAAEIVKLRVFAGMTIDEAAEHFGISPRTAKRSWAYARAWLGRELAVNRDLGP